jgi:hypothetical protein
MKPVETGSRPDLTMSPAPRAVRDVELAALEHVRPVEPGKQLRLQEPHAQILRSALRSPADE